MTLVLETERLWLRPLELSDAEQIQVLFSHWDLVQFLADRVPWPYPSDGALTYCRDIALPAVERGEEWHWTLRLKSVPSRVIGCISLMKAENHNRGFWLGLQWQGQCLMSEACDAVTDFWFDVLKFPVLRAPKAMLMKHRAAFLRGKECASLPPKSESLFPADCQRKSGRSRPRNGARVGAPSDSQLMILGR